MINISTQAESILNYESSNPSVRLIKGITEPGGNGPQGYIRSVTATATVGPVWIMQLLQPEQIGKFYKESSFHLVQAFAFGVLKPVPLPVFGKESIPDMKNRAGYIGE